MASSRKRKILPGPSTAKEERAQLKKWEVVYVNTSGKFQVKSARGYYYYTVFVDRKDGEKIAAIYHAKKRHLPIAFLQFTVRVGTSQRLLIPDGAGELIETKLQQKLLARGCIHEVAAKGEHHVNVPAERAIQELDTMMRACIHESNLPFMVFHGGVYVPSRHVDVLFNFEQVEDDF